MNAIADEDDTPKARRPGMVAAPPLDTLGIEELRDYIAALRAEITRAEAAIAKKDTHRNAADAFFRKP